MNAFEKFLIAIALLTSSGENAVPVYGVFHLCFLAAAVTGCVLVCVFCRNLSEKALRIIITVTGFVLILLEVYKQLVFSYALYGTWRYDWGSFPFQFCSTPMYIAPFAGLLRNGRFRDMCMSYLSTFSLTAGFIVMVFAGGVFETPSLGVAVQTMVYHGAMLVLGVLILANDRKRLGIKYWLKSLPLFCGLFVLAYLFNVIFYYAMPGVYIDLYYISPFYISQGLPVATDVKTVLTGAGVGFLYPVIYLILFAGVSLAAVYLAKWLFALCVKLQNKKQQ